MTLQIDCSIEVMEVEPVHMVQELVAKHGHQKIVRVLNIIAVKATSITFGNIIRVYDESICDNTDY